MVFLEAKDLLRVVLLSGMVGFAAFSLSYGIFVWRKRNAAGRQPKSWWVKVGQVVFVLGCLGMGIAWATNEFQARTGIVEGSGLFVAHARHENADVRITSKDSIAQGDIVAEFVSPADRTELAAIDLQRAQAEAKRSAIDKEVLQLDQGLLQQQSHLSSELLQLKGFAFELRKTRYQAERSRTDLLTVQTREESELNEKALLEGTALAKALGQREFTRRALERGQGLQKRQYIPEQEMDTRVAADIAADLTAKEHKEAIDSLGNRLKALETRFAASNVAIDNQLSEIGRDSINVEAAIEALETKEKEFDHAVAEDRARAILSRSRAVEAVQYDINIFDARKARLTEALQVRAPFAGKLVYRHPSPGLAAENTPILAISAGPGFAARIRIPRTEVVELASQLEGVKVALDNPVLHRFFTARFVRAEPIASEPGWVIAYLDCGLPPEMMAFMARSLEPVRVKLLWRPSLTLHPGFQFSLLLAAASVAAFLFGLRRPLRDTGSKQRTYIDALHS